MNEQAKDFYLRFQRDCDRRGTTLVDKFREVLKNLLLYRRSFILVDLPPKLAEFSSRAEEQQSGQLDPLLTTYDPRQAINWSCDSIGRLEWIIFHVRNTEPQRLARPKTVDRWYYFDRNEFATYERQVPNDETSMPDDAMATLVAGGPHQFSAQGVIPVLQLEVPEGLWLMNRAYLPVIDQLNTDNVLGWALTMAALAMPVIMSDTEVSPTLTEAGFILLPKGSTYSWSEPVGTSFQHLATREQSLVEHIFRSFYLVAQARSTQATPAAQSGYSKEQDMAPAKKVLNLFGDLMRAAIDVVMTRVSMLRGDSINWSVTGLEFPEDSPKDAVDVTTSAMALNIPSTLVEKELYKRAVDCLFPEINSELRSKMHAEIEAAKTREERAAALMETATRSIDRMTGEI